ncbi:MAG TPA: glycoside hydrolase domain-containing protein [Phycisphaerae bacterium]|nr:glycoside hydrolase domain-containing protein [Phycisphaerae bacterium]
MGMRRWAMVLAWLVGWAGVANAEPAAELPLWAHSYLEPMARDLTPPGSASATLHVRTTPGEYEPAVLAVRAGAEITAEMTFEALEGAEAVPRSWLSVNRVESLNAETSPKRLMGAGRTQSLPADQTVFYWLTVRPPVTTAPGTYRTTIAIDVAGKRHTAELVCEVLPFVLVDSPIIGGAFMAGTDLPRRWYRDMKAHGINAIQMFWNSTGMDVRQVGGKLVMDFEDLDRFMDEVNAGGIDGPIAISLGNDSSLHYEREIAGAFGMPVRVSEPIGGKRIKAPQVSPELDRLFVEGLRQIREHWDAKGYRQELIVLIYDEPTERLLERCKSRYDLLKTVMPDTRVYGVVMNRQKWAASMLDQCDIIVANGDFERCRDLSAEHNKDYWIYGFPLQEVHTARHDMGLLAWRVGASGVFFWMYNYWGYDPDNCAVYVNADNPTEPVRSVAWEAIREGQDDLRYVATAAKLIALAPPDVREKAAAKLEAIRLSLDPSRRRRAPRGEEHDEVSLVQHVNEPQRVRDAIIELILELR